ncbi:MAG TPA: hypothetical protein VGV38_10855 [Pyrinomonadaceae bacterium]|nr:hypothetical protein [Pyrinomonadaceae bacterium]
MNRLFFKLFIAFWTNLLGLMLVQAFLDATRGRAEFENPARFADTWQPPRTSLEAPGLVEDAHGSEHPMSPFGLRAIITADPFGTYLQPVWDWYRVESALPARCNGCTAEVFRLELDAEPGPETVLRVGNQSRYQYLFFKPDLCVAHHCLGSGWKLVGVADDILYKYETPPHFTVAAGGGRHWLVVQDHASTQDAAVLYRNRAFEVTAGGVSEVLSYPSSGYYVAVRSEPERSFETLLLEVNAGRREETVRVQFNSHYYRAGERVSSRQQQAVFARRGGAGPFLFDPRRSDLSREEFESVHGSAVLGVGDFPEVQTPTSSRPRLAGRRSD